MKKALPEPLPKTFKIKKQIPKRIKLKRSPLRFKNKIDNIKPKAFRWLDSTKRFFLILFDIRYIILTDYQISGRRFVPFAFFEQRVNPLTLKC